MNTDKTLVITSGIPHQNLMSLCPDTNGSGWRILYNPPAGTRCDFWIVFSTSRPADRMQCAPENTLYLAGEPPSKKVHPRRFYAQFKHVFSCNPDDPHPQVEVGAPCLNWHVGLNSGTREYRFGYDYLSRLRAPEKVNRISVVCSNLTTTDGQRRRLTFLDTLKSRLGDKLVHFGRGFTPIDDKLDAILPYAYHLVLENSSTPHYWTEKLSDAYLGHAFPFYLGSPNLHEYFPERAFIEVNPDDPAGCASQIEDAIANNLYVERMADIEAARDRVLNQYNFFTHCIRLADARYDERAEIRRHGIESHRAFRPFPRNWLYLGSRILKGRRLS